MVFSDIVENGVVFLWVHGITVGRHFRLEFRRVFRARDPDGIASPGTAVCVCDVAVGVAAGVFVLGTQSVRITWRIPRNLSFVS